MIQIEILYYIHEDRKYIFLNALPGSTVNILKLYPFPCVLTKLLKFRWVEFLQ
mgnify:CR=1 FL=1